MQDHRDALFFAESFTSAERVTTTRAVSDGVSVASKALQSMGLPLKSVSSLLEPNRFASPDAIKTHPTGSIG